MTIGSLFSGIGGLELGLEWAGHGPVIWQVEQDEKLRNCLAHHWPEAKRFEDVNHVGTAQLVPVDLICGGFPCQDLSSLGKRAGIHGTRSGLWVEVVRIVDELRPLWVVIENVASGATKWVDHLRLALARIGYASLPIPLSAYDVGAPQKYRRRVFLVAHAPGLSEREPHAEAHTEPGSGEAWSLSVGGSAIAPYPHGNGIREQPGWRQRPGGAAGSGEPERHAGWSTEPTVARVVHGFPGRVDRERALGNSVVPQCAQVVGEVINMLSGHP